MNDAMEKIEEAGAGQRELSRIRFDGLSTAEGERIQVRALHLRRLALLFLRFKLRLGRSSPDDEYRETYALRRSDASAALLRTTAICPSETFGRRRVSTLSGHSRPRRWMS
jgi:hypothetical protein